MRYTRMYITYELKDCEFRGNESGKAVFGGKFKSRTEMFLSMIKNFTDDLEGDQAEWLKTKLNSPASATKAGRYDNVDLSSDLHNIKVEFR